VGPRSPGSDARWSGIASIEARREEGGFAFAPIRESFEVSDNFCIEAVLISSVAGVF
jgi:hypothetical protein